MTPGPDFGRLQRGESVNGVSPDQVMGPERKGRKVVISGDSAPCDAIAIASDHADLLVHEATFAEEERERAGQTAHSTARQAAELAREASVRMLAITHVSSRYVGGELREQAREIFPATEAPRDFDTIAVPFPERGGPVLERWSDRQARERNQTQRAAGPLAGHPGVLIDSPGSFNPVPRGQEGSVGQWLRRWSSTRRR